MTFLNTLKKFKKNLRSNSCIFRGNPSHYKLVKMIGIFTTTHPTEGYQVSIRYSRVDGVVRILGIHTHGKDIFAQLTWSEIEILKYQIK